MILIHIGTSCAIFLFLLQVKGIIDILLAVAVLFQHIPVGLVKITREGTDPGEFFEFLFLRIAQVAAR